uniref:Serine/threonine-protein kinase 17A n=1 Tax=Cacopsylla melanoneura TaxID=428564 RepID=A0A8D8VIF2_9HEMI
MITDPMASHLGCRSRTSGTRKSPDHTTKREVVQWKERNVSQGVVIVDEEQLLKLIKVEPIEKYYSLDPEPFATGMFASVRRCRSLATGQVFAAKFSSRTRYGEDCTKEIHHEIALLSLCSPSPRIVKLHDVFQTDKELIIVMEYAPGGDMQTIIDDNLVPFESDVVKFIQQLVEGLAYLHHRKIAHLDIKPQNIVMMGDFPNCDIKVCDFEISRVILDGIEIRELLGTPDYVAPEILHYEPITLAADMWSLGVTAYVLLTGFSPFGGETDSETFRNISKAQLDFPDELFEDISPEAKDFIAKILIKNPKERMTAKEALKHPWLMNKKQIMTRVGCSSCPSIIQNQQNKKNLRKYLSKSREALFEKVISASKQQQENLRKSALLKYNKTRRLCESQMSLMSKTREKSLGDMSISLGRSKEKLYGFRCLSKSQEVLNLYKSMKDINNIRIDEIMKNINEKKTTENIKKENNSDNVHQENIKNQSKNEESSRAHRESPTKQKSPTRQDINETRQRRSPDKNTRRPSRESLEKTKIDDSNDNLIKTNANCKIENNNDKDRRKDNESSKRVKRQDTFTRQTSREDQKETTVRKLSREENKDSMPIRKSSREESRELICEQIIKDDTRVRSDRKLSRDDSKDSNISKSKDEINPNIRRISREEKMETMSHTSSDDASSVEDDSLEYLPGVYDEDCYDDEPRFSVAQLISAYNYNEEVAKRNIAPRNSSKFPIGPNALRLFIPNIDITSKKLALRKKTFVVRNHSSIHLNPNNNNNTSPTPLS